MKNIILIMLIVVNLIYLFIYKINNDYLKDILSSDSKAFADELKELKNNNLCILLLCFLTSTLTLISIFN